MMPMAITFLALLHSVILYIAHELQPLAQSLNTGPDSNGRRAVPALLGRSIEYLFSDLWEYLGFRTDLPSASAFMAKVLSIVPLRLRKPEGRSVKTECFRRSDTVKQTARPSPCRMRSMQEILTSGGFLSNAELTCYIIGLQDGRRTPNEVMNPKTISDSENDADHTVHVPGSNDSRPGFMHVTCRHVELYHGGSVTSLEVTLGMVCLGAIVCNMLRGVRRASRTPKGTTT